MKTNFQQAELHNTRGGLSARSPFHHRSLAVPRKPLSDFSIMPMIGEKHNKREKSICMFELSRAVRTQLGDNLLIPKRLSVSSRESLHSNAGRRDCCSSYLTSNLSGIFPH